MKKLISTLIAVALLLILLFGSSSITQDNRNSELLGAYTIQEFEDSERIIWTFDGKGTVTQSFYGFYRVETINNETDIIFSHEKDKDGLHARDFTENVWSSILSEPSILEQEPYLVSWETTEFDKPVTTSYIFHPNGTYEKRVELPYTYDGKELVFFCDIYNVSSDPANEDIYHLKYKGNINADASMNRQFLFDTITMTLVPLDKNFDYEFYSVNGNENDIVAFMPDTNIFTFELGTYSIESENTLVLNGPKGKETYEFSNPTVEGDVIFTKDGEEYHYKTHTSEGGFLNGFLKGTAPFESYACFYDQASDCEITFDTDGTYVKQNHYSYAQFKGYISILDTYSEDDNEQEEIMYQYTCDERTRTLNFAQKESDYVSYQLVRMDNFDDEGIEEGTFVGLNDREYKYQRVLIQTSPYAGEEDNITYRIVYTDDLSITGEQIYQDYISGTFIPFSEKGYQGIHTW